MKQNSEKKLIYIWQYDSWPEFKWDLEKILPVLSLARKTQRKLLTLASAVGLEVQADFLTQDAKETSAIEGEKIDIQSLRSSIARRLGLSTVGLSPEKRNLEGLVEMLFDATQNFSEPLTEKRLFGWQAGLFPTGYSGVHKIEAGQWRTSSAQMKVVSGKMGEPKVHFEAPPSKVVPKEMRIFLKWFNSRSVSDGLIRAAVAHIWFITIHPFEDGNGRLARAISDLALAQDEDLATRCYSLSSQISLERKKYYEILEKTQKGNLNITEWIIWFLENYASALKKSEIIIARAVQVREFWLSNSHVDINLRQRKVIQKMLEFEPEGFKGGMTNRKYVSLTKISPASAKRDLIDLEEKGLIKRNTPKGRSVSYSLVLKG